MKTNLTIIGLAALILAGCSTNSGVVAISGDTYMISRNNAAGAFSNIPKMKVEVIQQANEFAASKGKVVQVISLDTTFPTHGFPSVDYQFKLVDPTNTPASK